MPNETQLTNLAPADYPTLLRVPKYGYRNCATCEEPISLKIKRDQERKRYCSRPCRLRGAMLLMRAEAQRLIEAERNAPTKVCRRCESEFPRTRQFFSFAKRTGDQYTVAAYCRICHSEIAKENATKKWGTLRNRHLRNTYGMSEDEFNERMAAQGGLCGICKIRKPMCVDHNHETGEIRGLLCNGCNAAIGIFNEDEEIFRRALDYLGIAIIPVREG